MGRDEWSAPTTSSGAILGEPDKPRSADELADALRGVLEHMVEHKEQEADELPDAFATAHVGGPANALVVRVGPSLPHPAPRTVRRPKAHRRSAKAARKRNRR